MNLFKDRSEAGLLLAEKLKSAIRKNTIILGLPRGGVEVAAAVSRRLDLPLGVIVAKKLRHPDSPEFSIGAVADGGGVFIDPRFEKSVNQDYLKSEIAEKEEQIKAYVREFGESAVRGKECVIVDDGIATGNTIFAAISSARKQGAKRIIVAVPVLPNVLVPIVKKATDILIYLYASDEFFSVGQFYRQFPQVTTEEVIQLLQSSRPEN